MNETNNTNEGVAKEISALPFQDYINRIYKSLQNIDNKTRAFRKIDEKVLEDTPMMSEFENEINRLTEYIERIDNELQFEKVDDYYRVVK